MSDGPHRSLNMRRGWKKVAEFADNRTFDPAQVSDTVIAAFNDDWRAEVSPEVAGGVRDILGGQEDSLFRDQKVMQLEALRRVTAGHGLGQVLIDCALRAVLNPAQGADPAVEAAANALAIWGARHGRQIEEHYCRESTDSRAASVRERIEEGINHTPLQGLARQLLGLDPAPVPRKPRKQTGLDEGARL
jgi:hypothetical protein